MALESVNLVHRWQGLSDVAGADGGSERRWVCRIVRGRWSMGRERLDDLGGQLGGQGVGVSVAPFSMDRGNLLCLFDYACRSTVKVTPSMSSKDFNLGSSPRAAASYRRPIG